MYQISFAEREAQLRQVLDFCYGILGEHLREAAPYRQEDWIERMEEDNKLLVYAYEDGEVISAVLGRRESGESLVCGFAACKASRRRQGITKRSMLYLRMRQSGQDSGISRWVLTRTGFMKIANIM